MEPRSPAPSGPRGPAPSGPVKRAVIGRQQHSTPSAARCGARHGRKLLIAGVCVQMFLLALRVKVCSGAGRFELQVLSVLDGNGQVQTGACCGRPGAAPGGACAACAAFFRVCLKEFQVRVSAGGPCTYGSAATPVLGGDSFDLRDAGRVVVPFSFAWPRSYTLTVEMLNYSNTSAAGVLMARAVHSGAISPGLRWHNLRWHNGSAARLQYRVRLRCEDGYYGPRCTRFCRPRDDFFGHYECSAAGNKTCLGGWRGADCSAGRCLYGWHGDLCDQCVPYPGCVHGSCLEPWQCLCDTNYGGQLCDKGIDECLSNPCQHGGVCEVLVSGGFRCVCPPQWTGKTCLIDADECERNPCGHAHSCRNLIGGYLCACLPGWTGQNCDTTHARACVAGVAAADGSRWSEDCNVCHCLHGRVTCTKRWCGPRLCNLHTGGAQCPAGHTCVAVLNEHCFVKPCPSGQGECRPAAPSQPCHADRRCANITFSFNKDAMEQGVTVQQVCEDLKKLYVMRNLSVSMACHPSPSAANQILLSIWPEESRGTFISDITQSTLEQVGKLNATSDLIAAITEVRLVRRQPAELAFSMTADRLVPLMVAAVIVVWALLVAMALLWCLRKRRKQRGHTGVSTLPLPTATEDNNAVSCAASGAREQLRHFKNAIDSPSHRYHANNALHANTACQSQTQGAERFQKPSPSYSLVGRDRPHHPHSQPGPALPHYQPGPPLPHSQPGPALPHHQPPHPHTGKQDNREVELGYSALRGLYAV
ncbi:unnamed protein product [Merluccius merluccius]